MPLLNMFWTMLWFFLFIIWLMLLFRVFGDIFRSDMSGGGKALWIILVILVPFLGVLIYLIAHGGDMQKRAMEGAAAQQAAQQQYIQDVAGPATSSADELEKLANLHKSGVLNDEEFAAEKTKILS